MKKALILSFILLATNVHAGQWRGGDGGNEILGSTNISDIDYNSYNYIVNPLDRLLSNYREGLKLTYSSASQLTVTAGEVMLSNSDGSIRLMVKESASSTVTWANIDAGAEASATTYYVYASVSAASDEDITFYISTSSTAPTGATYYKRIGSFYNNASGNIEQVTNDNDTVSIGSGTIANGATISLPTGFSQDECDWIVSPGNHSSLVGISNPDGVQYLAYASSSRVVTCTATSINSGASYTLTCNYLIACHK